MSDFLNELRKENENKRQELQNKKLEAELKSSSKELDNKLNSFNKNKKDWNSEYMKGRIKFWAIAIVCGIAGSLIFYKIVMKFIG